MKPTVKLNCPAAAYSAPNERIVEVFDRETRKGCLISIRVVKGDLIIEPYRAEAGVFVRVSGDDMIVPQ